MVYYIQYCYFSKLNPLFDSKITQCFDSWLCSGPQVEMTILLGVMDRSHQNPEKHCFFFFSILELNDKVQKSNNTEWTKIHIYKSPACTQKI